MKELPVGSEIVLKVVESEGCDECFFNKLSSEISENICKRIKCALNERIDKKNVQFKMVK